MPEYLAPGVYVEEVSFRPKSIEGVGTSTTAFVGPTRKGPLFDLNDPPRTGPFISGVPEVITSFGEFERVYGGVTNLSFNAGGDAAPQEINYLAHAVRAFFDNGGSRLYIGRTFIPRTNLDGSIASDGIARSQPIVDLNSGDPNGQIRFVARMPGSGLNLKIEAFQKASPTDATTLTNAPAGSLLQVGGNNPAQPSILQGGFPPFILNNGDRLTFTSISGNPNEINFTGANAEVTGNALTLPIANPDGAILSVRFNNGVEQRIPIPADIADLPALQAFVATLNTNLRGGYARLEGSDRIVIGSDRAGTSSQVVANAALFGFDNATSAPAAGNVTNLEAVTVGEIQQILQSAGVPVQVTLPPATGRLTISSNATGNAVTLTVQDSNARNALGLPLSGQPGADGDALAYYRKQGDSWIGGTAAPWNTTLNLSDPLANPQLLTLNLVIRDADGMELVLEQLGFDPDHPQWLGTVLRENPSRRSDALLNPCFLQVGAAVPPVPQAFLLRNALFGNQSSTTIFLTGGNDGVEPVTNSTVPNAIAVRDALELLQAIDDVSIIAAPGHSTMADFITIQSALMIHAEQMKYRIAVLDTPPANSISQAREVRSRIDNKYAALYYPWVIVANPAARPGNDRIPKEIALPPSGFVAGIYARTDVQRGVWKAPANEVVQGILRFETEINFRQQGILNPEGINCLRFFPGRSNRVWGARTASSDPEWKYVNVRRYFMYLEKSIDRASQWAVFEPNGEALWSNIQETVSSFLYTEWRNGALLGATPEEAYFVRCDRSTITQNDLDNGRLICLIGVAAIKPAEFVIFRIGQKTADART
ncbi:phage tail sheath family protein [Leptolyngbya ohadii]|uniref:phage tail sheath family protein n=1 Tax=Leptolyngbya ohadii TaxID=1962290 RepID=UPI0019D49FB9|nr:phage tail sheath subtilisin-like domain-containing protein [Leptolyngbya ohadii]